MTLNQWLSARYAASTAKAYRRVIDLWIHRIGRKHAPHAVYNDVAAWIGGLREQRPNPASLRVHVHGLRAYYSWLVEMGVRTDDPTRSLLRAGRVNRHVHLPDLLTATEVRRLREHAAGLEPRLRVTLELLSYSALTSREVSLLTTESVNLEAGTIDVPATGRTEARQLKLTGVQHNHLVNYLEEARPALVSAPTNMLLLTSRGTPVSVDVIHHQVTRLRPVLPGRKLTPTLIRQSVIAMMLGAGRELRSVQLFAGHRYPSSTERYRFTDLAELRAAVTQFHVMQ